MNAPAVRAILVSVGGAPAPLLFTLRKHRPAHVWYFSSAGSRPVADEIHAQLEWHPIPRFIQIERFEELGPCYRELRRKIPELLAEARVHPGEVLVDYTSGTKTMTAALVLAGTELFDQFSYVGAAQRDKAGLGIAIDGKERVFYQTNPWSELAVREVARAGDLWASCQFEAAAQVLRDVAPRVARRLRFETLAEIAEAMAARHRLDFRCAVRLLGDANRKLAALFDGRDDEGLLAFAKSALKICSECAKDSANSVLLRELLDNALRTAAQGRYEDAAARLYRAMEMQGQLYLTEVTHDLFLNGRCKNENVHKVPEVLTELNFCKPDKRGEINLSLEQLYLALHALGDARAAKVTADLSLDNKSRWRLATEKRNTSILAHGVSPIGAHGFELMKQLATEFLDFDLAHEANPIQQLDSRWF